MKLQVLHEYPHEVHTFLAHATNAIDVGEMLQLSSNVVTPMSASTQNATFVGISGSESRGASDAGCEILVYTKCVCLATLTSAAYTFGDTLAWASATSLAADAGADTIAWFWDAMLTGQTITEGKVLFDLLMLASGSADNLVHIVHG